MIVSQAPTRAIGAVPDVKPGGIEMRHIAGKNGLRNAAGLWDYAATLTAVIEAVA